MSLFRRIQRRQPLRRQHHHHQQQQQIANMTHSMNRVVRRYVDTYGNPFQGMKVNDQNTVQNIVVIITPVMHGILTRYSEYDFHNVMSRTYYDENGTLCYGFDFIADQRRNHPLVWNIIMTILRSYKHKLRFDVRIASQLMCDIIHSWNWNLNQREKMGIYQMLVRVRRLIDNA